MTEVVSARRRFRVAAALVSAVVLLLVGLMAGRAEGRAGALPLGSADVAGLISPNLPAVVVDGATTNYVTWITPSAELPGTLYEVTRTSGPGSGSIICNAESISSASVATCPDYAVQPGTRYGYTITAMLGDYWHSDATVYGRTSRYTFELDVSNSAPAAGQPFAVTGLRVVAPGTESVVRTFSGSRTIRWSGLPVSAGGQAPAYPDGGTSTIRFRNGQADGLDLPFTSFGEGPNQLLASDDSNDASGTGTVTVGWGQGVGLAFGSQPSGGVIAGQALVASPQVYVIDAYGNVDGSSSRSVVLSLSGGPPGAALSCPGAPQGVAGATFGVASYSGCRIIGPAGTYRLAATSPGLATTGPSQPLTITAGMG